MRAAAADATAGDVVLLAPACASSTAIATTRSAASTSGPWSRSWIDERRPKSSQPIEYSLLLTATLCLLAFGVVMVFSASSTTSLLGESGDGAFYLKRTLIFGALGLVVMHLLARRG